MMVKKLFLFIVLVRALAAVLITNSHYIGVYPTDLIANGGLLGDVLFFAVSGFCLANSKGSSFGKWYFKRFIRIYFPMWMIRIVYILMGVFVITGLKSLFEYFIFPRDWHFISSIILLYVPLFFISRYVEMNKKNYMRIAIGLFCIQMLLYLLVYDYSFYHIDAVNEPMIEFLFFQSMLLGLHYRHKCEIENVEKPLIWWKIGLCFILGVLYFASKMIFVKVSSAAPYQILNQIVLWVLLYAVFDAFMNLENRLSKFQSGWVWKFIKFISDRTLEIYLVQFYIIAHYNIGEFPVNWIILTATILVSATVLRWCSQQIITRINL